MGVVIVTGSAGLIGSECVRFFSKLEYTVIGIDNDMRKFFFGAEASTEWNRRTLEKEFPSYEHYKVDVRDDNAIANIFKKYGSDIFLIIHAAAQPSHDWAKTEPLTDFSINASGTLILLENARKYCPGAVFIFTSTNKVYGDTSSHLPLIELETRWEIEQSHPYYNGIDESMSIDQSMHSLFGASKLSADLFVQEYGRYFGMKTTCFRCGCITGPSHSGTVLHGFLSYLMKCVITGKCYTIRGYKGKQVRDNLHSQDLVTAFYQFFKNPRAGEVYNIGGGRVRSCSILEAIEMCEEITGRKLRRRYSKEERPGDHVWWITDSSKFKSHYPTWNCKYKLEALLLDIYEHNIERWKH